MPIYNYKCECGYSSDTFVWKMEEVVLCPCCHKPMQRLFTGSNLHLLNRQKPVPFKYEQKECNATKELYESCRMDFKHKKTGLGELKFWKDRMERDHPEMIT